MAFSSFRIAASKCKVSCPDRDNHGVQADARGHLSRAGQCVQIDDWGSLYCPDRDIMNGNLDTPEQFGAALREIRRRRGLRLEDVALAAGVGIRFVSELERGKPTARLGHAMKVIAALGADLRIDDRVG
jgi:DNA-binding XRE family transcriptional regulator